MDTLFVRVLVAFVLMGLLWIQARKSPAELRYRRRSFEMAAAALLCFGVLNVTLALGLDLGPLQFVVMGLGGALFFVAFVMLVLSWRNGEMAAQHDQISAAAREYRKSRGLPDEEE